MAACTRKRGHVLLGGAGWTPQSIAGLQLWLKADAIVGLNDGDPVASWPDSSGNGYTVTQATPSKRPLWKQNILNGLPVVRYAGTDDYLANTSVADLAQFTGFAVANVTVNNSGVLAYVDVTGGVNTGYSLFYTAPSFYSRVAKAGGWDQAPIAYTASTWYAHEGHHDDSKIYIGLNGTEAAGVAAGPCSNVLAQVFVGILNATTFPLTGDLAEVVVYNTDIGTTNRSLVRAYLGTKYGITVV